MENINYQILKRSEKKLLKLFFEYFKHVINAHETLNQLLCEDNLEKRKELIKTIYEMEDQSNRSEFKLINESIWTISKNSPLASHLRLTITIIMSSRDLERICDYANNLTKFIEHYLHLDIKIFNNLVTLHQSALNNLKKTFESLQDKEKPLTLQFENATKTIIEFEHQYRLVLTKYYETINKNEVTEKIFLIDLVASVKHIERINDYCYNIIKSFLFIKNPEIFN
ncbi:phosphate signaling complex protein PhoU [Mycoplasmoides genitalium]